MASFARRYCWQSRLCRCAKRDLRIFSFFALLGRRIASLKWSLYRSVPSLDVANCQETRNELTQLSRRMSRTHQIEFSQTHSCPMNRKLHPFLPIALPFFMLVVGLQGGAYAQPSRTPLKIDPKTDEFKAAVDDFREVMKEMQSIATHYNTAKKGQVQKWKDKWNEMYPTVVQTFHSMLQAGAKEYAADPENSLVIASWLFKIAGQETEEDRYEGLLPILETLAMDKPEFVEAQRLFAVTSFALSEYERGRKAIEFLANGEQYPQLKIYSENIDRLIEQRDREMQARKQDAEGEPLPKVLIRTNKGDIEVELFENHAPETVANFISLVEEGFYDHKALSGVKHFAVFGGVEEMAEAPPYTIYSEREKEGARAFLRGTMGMTLTKPESPDSAYGQFFFSLLPNQELQHMHTAFGRVTKGIEIMAALQKIDPRDKEKEDKKKSQPDEILEMVVLSKRDHPYVPNKVK